MSSSATPSAGATTAPLPHRTGAPAAPAEPFASSGARLRTRTGPRPRREVPAPGPAANPHTNPCPEGRER